MKYFNSQKLAFNFDIKEEDFIGLGTQDSIFKYGSQNCIKIYYDTDVPVFDQEMFDKFKSLDLKRFGQLIDLFYTSLNQDRVAGYIMTYYPQIKDNILFMSKDYTLDSLSTLYSDFLLISKENILLKDIYYKNTIQTNEGIVLIDYENAKLSNKDFDKVLELNVRALLYAFKGIYKKAFARLGVNFDTNFSIEDYLTYLFSYSKDPPKTLSLKLKETKIPIESLYRNAK